MKNLFINVSIFFISLNIGFSGTPTLDGSFDGVATWGTPVATADGNAGWSSVDVDKLYVTYDGTYYYFAASFNSGGEPANWMRAGFAINTTSGGGSSCPWGSAVTFGHSAKPDFVLVGRLGDGSNYAEMLTWDGSDWDDGSGTDVFDTDMDWDTSNRTYVEGRISKSDLSSP
ncbi:MAG: hypothetical protein HON82_02745, partial [Candidatus Marinimicrobia bacterium]|nr:hypothetical protein [Candidatus Neomarinimicrobiota bacterium]